MPLNDAAADAALDVWLASQGIRPPPVGAHPSDPSAQQYTAMRSLFAPLVRAIFASIVANGLVFPDGVSPMAAGVNPVTGIGRIG